MSSHFAHALAALATMTVVGCESANTPMGPSRVPVAAVAPSIAPEGFPLTTPMRAAAVSGIVVNRGEFDFSANAGVMSLYGSRNFSLTARMARGAGVIEAIETCFASNCEPGTSIPLSATWSGNDLPAEVTLDGTTYTDVGSLAGNTSARVQFDGTARAPALTDALSDTLSAPFTLVGEFMHPGTDGQLVTDRFTGEGTVKLWLVREAGSTGWSVQRLLYRFKHRG